MIVWNDKGVSVSFPVPQVGHRILDDWGWTLRRELWGYAGDGVWRIFSITLDEGKTFRLPAIDDRNKNRIALTYDDGKLVEVKDSAGRIVTVMPAKDGRIGALRVEGDDRGPPIDFARYEYDDAGRLTRVTDADGHSWTYEYDEFNRLVRDTDRVGLSFCFRYDAKDRGIEAWGEYAGPRDPSLADDVPKFLYDGRTRAKGIHHRKLEYHSRGYTEVTDTTETRRYFGNAKGTVDKAVTGGAVTSSRYDERGFQIEKTDPMEATWRWERDERGHVRTIADPLERTTRIERDTNGLPVRVIDPRGGVTRARRDPRGNLELVRYADGGTTRFQVDERGLMTDALGATTRYGYDAHGNLTELVQPNGGRWLLGYDAFGRVLNRMDPTGAQTRYVHSDRGDLVAVHDAAGGVTRYTYDGEHHIKEMSSPTGHTTHLYWGGYHKLCARRDANGHRVRLAYSREGELVAITNERDEVHRLSYDASGRLVGEETFDGRTLRYRHDLAGRPVRVENGAGEMSTGVYDLAGQLVERALPDDTTEIYEYDARGELSRATCAAGESRFGRDALGRVVRETCTVAGQDDWVEVTYDLVGNAIGRATSRGRREEVERDAMGSRVRTMLDGEHRIGHVRDVLAREIQRGLPEGGAIESVFDPLGRLVQRLVRAPSEGRAVHAREPEWMGRRDDGVTAGRAYAYAADGELISRTDRARGLTRYEYDPVGRLLAAVPEKAGAEVFRYDPTANVYEAGGEGTDREYGRGKRLLRRGSTEFVWDDDGWLARKVDHGPTGDRIWRYAWNGAGLLERVDRPDGSAVDFAYDPLRRRVSKRVLERQHLTWRVVRSTRFVWDADVLVHAIHEAADDPASITTFCFEDEGYAPAVQWTRPEAPADGRVELLHFGNAPIGTPECLVRSDGTIAEDLALRPWGAREPTERTDRAGTALRLPGQYYDEETGLSYNRFRYYDAVLGLFISSDPLRLAAGLNFFAYCPNPFVWQDPSGLTGT